MYLTDDAVRTPVQVSFAVRMLTNSVCCRKNIAIDCELRQLMRQCFAIQQKVIKYLLLR